MIRSELVQKLCSDFPDLSQREVEVNEMIRKLFR